jgi:hypothetical protein
MCVETALLLLVTTISIEGTETCSKATQFVTFCDGCSSKGIAHICRFRLYVIEKEGVIENCALGTSMLIRGMRLDDDS